MNESPSLLFENSIHPLYSLNRRSLTLYLALTSTFGATGANTFSTKYRSGANVETDFTSTFDTSPEYQDGTNIEPTLASTFDLSPEYRTGTNIEPALTSAFSTTNVEPASTSIFGTRPEYRAGVNVEPALRSTFNTSFDYRAVYKNI
ncbi:hypothetical protein DPMN_023195 [Dreissena polymorpha]|uniref:Uncharacterized protein n=1 Tax=Dreissena polymorpha TaxID=45954 RepID=A0A9D4LLW3_DREPO|nr:hypothetical protein DPMN_023195 [Dreissena polymorpha]